MLRTHCSDTCRSLLLHRYHLRPPAFVFVHSLPDALLSARVHSVYSSGAHGATLVADHSLASSILHSARKKFLAKKSIAKRHAAHRAAKKSLDGFTLDKKAQAALEGKKLIDGGAPTSSLLTRMPVANSAKVCVYSELCACLV